MWSASVLHKDTPPILSTSFNFMSAEYVSCKLPVVLSFHSIPCHRVTVYNRLLKRTSNYDLPYRRSTGRFIAHLQLPLNSAQLNKEAGGPIEYDIPAYVL